MSHRTLRRMLYQKGASWRQLLEHARHDRARQLLENTDLTLDRIAHAFGLSGAAVLVRAFAHWEGVTPGAYRHRRESPKHDSTARW
ncbi:helix-turn-helix domain-containing protein [Streptomyces sp. NPDC058251]|uniref:helix-turn-helix domain-containing protein n=1 Tax=unclassified Streptomyces TaxID=2593676 RepID=UPI00365DA066